METITSKIAGGDGGLNSEAQTRDQLVKTVESLQKAQKAQSMANDLKSKAMALTDSTQREKMLREAYEKEVEAHGHSKMAKRLESGTWQGLGFGGGIGAATGLGLGATIGTVLGVVAAVPTTGLGMLVGSGVGAIHGPWIKLRGKEEKFEDADPNQIADALEDARNADSKTNSEPEVTPPSSFASTEQREAETEKPRRKPKKLEIRSHSKDGSNTQYTTSSDSSVKLGTGEDSKPRRKPKKLEIRSAGSGSEAAFKARA